MGKKKSIAISSILLFIVFAGMLYQRLQPSRVLGARTYLTDNEKQGGSNDENTSNQEKSDTIEPTDLPEPTDVPEKQQAVENVQHKIDKQIESDNLDQIEIQPSAEGSDSGRVLLQQFHGTTQELQAPSSNTTPVTQITTPQAGTLSVHVGASNVIVINNGPYTITTQYPVIINPTDQTMAIRTPSGVTVIKTFPTQVFQNVPAESKLSAIHSLNLTDQQGTPIYRADGIQIRKFLGIIPVHAQVKEDVNAQTGQVVNTSLPWYYSLFGFAFSST